MRRRTTSFGSRTDNGVDVEFFPALPVICEQDFEMQTAAQLQTEAEVSKNGVASGDVAAPSKPMSFKWPKARICQQAGSRARWYSLGCWSKCGRQHELREDTTPFLSKAPAAKKYISSGGGHLGSYVGS